jgi:hypothetical protein
MKIRVIVSNNDEVDTIPNMSLYFEGYHKVIEKGSFVVELTDIELSDYNKARNALMRWKDKLETLETLEHKK